MNTKVKHYVSLMFIALILVIASIIIEREFIERHKLTFHLQLKNNLNQLNSLLTLKLYKNIQAVKGLPALFQLNPNLSQHEFGIAVKQLFDEHTLLLNIGAAPDLILTYMYPMQGNEAAIGLDYRKQPLQIDAVMKAKHTKQLTLSGPLKLDQGGTGLIARLPIFLENEVGAKSFWGIVSATIDVNQLIKQSGLLDENLTIEVAIRNKSRGVFFGSSSLFDNEHIESAIELPGGAWQIAAIPKGGWSTSTQDIWNIRLYVFVPAFLLFLLMHAFIREAIKASTANKHFHTIFKEATLGVAIIDSLTGDIFNANPAYSRITGRSLTELKTLNWMTITHPDEKKEISENLAAITAGEKSSFTMQLRFIQPDRSSRWINMTVTAMEIKGQRNPRHLCMAEDVTSQKTTENNFAEVNSLFKNVINSSDDLIFVKDSQLCTILCNTVYCQTVGKTSIEMYGKTDREIGFDAELIQGNPATGVLGWELDDKAALAGKFIHNPYDPAMIEGEIRIFDTKKFPLKDSQGNIIGVLGIGRDSTVRVQAEEKLKLSARVFRNTHEGI
ncbi:MAG: two-component system sensor histidine kinase/response regulator, partial [Oceanospirillaceae bacterium]